MMKPGRMTSAICTSVMSLLFVPDFASGQVLQGHPAMTCDRASFDRGSYEMITIGQAQALLADRTDFWDGFRINHQVDALQYLNMDVRELAERALRADPQNMMAQSVLARQYTILGWDRAAADAWRQVIDHGGSVVWTATLYDVDYKSYFLMAFGRDGVRIYRMGQFIGPIDRSLGYAKFPPPSARAFYEAAAGCPDPSVVPMATIPWSDVREVRSGNWVLWFKLARPISLLSDRGKKKSLREIKVNLHGATGDVMMLAERNPDFEPGWDSESEAWTNVRGIGLGPWDYNRRVRDTILQAAVPQGHIKRTSTGRGAGW